MDSINDRFLLAVGKIDDDFLAEYEKTDVKALSKQIKRTERVRPLSVIVSLFLVLVLLPSAISDLFIPSVPSYENAYFSADDIKDLYYSDLLFGGPTQFYATTTVWGVPKWNIDNIRSLTELPIYHTIPRYGIASKDEFEAFISKYQSAVTSIIKSDCTFEIKESKYTNSDRDIISYYANDKDIRFDGEAPFNRIIMNTKRAEINYPDALPTFRRYASDKEITKAVMPFAEFVLSAFQKDYPDYRINRYYYSINTDCTTSISVEFYNASQSISSEVDSLTGEKQEYLEFSFYVENDDDSDILKLSSIYYYEMTQQKKESYNEIARLRKLSLKEAEALLKNGYYFADSVCGFCAANSNKAVDFTKGYDRVSLVYRESKNGVSVPFYCFYVKTRHNIFTGVREYGYVYVPAIEVSGLADYFEGQHIGHSFK